MRVIRPNVELFPNPAKSEVTVRMKQINDNNPANKIQDIRDVKIFDKLGNMMKSYKYPSNSKQVTMNVSTLPFDIYIVEISDGKNKVRLQLSVQR